MSDVSKVFFGYPSRPELSREPLARAAQRLDGQPDLSVGTWEDLRISGHLIIDRILNAIDESDVAVFDVTTLNANVLFEVGYAIASDSRIWLLRDPTNREAERRWNEVAILKSVGYEKYVNANHIFGSFMRDRPDKEPTTLYASAIEPTLDPISDPVLFNVRGLYNTEADRLLGRTVERERRSGIRITVADSRESSVEALTWYAYHAYQSAAVLIHLCGPERHGAEIHNARCSFIGGLARGFKRRVLMLAESTYEVPLDYRDILYKYDSAREARRRADAWLDDALKYAHDQLDAGRAEVARRSLSTELAGVRLGEPVAENEQDRLSTYFVPTSQYDNTLSRETTIFVGRKGTGKTANLLRAAEELERDRRNLVCVIRPSDYDLDGLVRVLKKYTERDTRGYVIESLWKYLLYTEIALAAEDDFAQRPAPMLPDSPEGALSNYLRGPGSMANRDFSVRLETAVERLLEVTDAEGVTEERASISELLHAGTLRDLRTLLVKALVGRDRVAVLIDNLDQAWDPAADLDQLSGLLLGLLGTVGRISEEFGRGGRDRGLVVTLAVFLRSDIFVHVARRAREPDKLPVVRLSWPDPEALLSLVEERYAASRDGSLPTSELWERYFDPNVRGMPTRDYMVSRVLPRPRDILTLCNSAIDAAVRRRHQRVEEQDVLDAEVVYSQFAFEAIQVESVGTEWPVEELLYAFAGCPRRLEEADALDLVAAAVGGEAGRTVVEHLVGLSFLGVETSAERFEYAEDPGDLRRLLALSAGYGRTAERPPQYEVHPAFHAYLGIDATPAGQTRLSLGEKAHTESG